MNQVKPTYDQFDMTAKSRSTVGRNILSGALKDDNGSGQFVLVRRNQSGFTDHVDFTPGEAGIAAINTLNQDREAAQDVEAEVSGIKASLNYQFSVNPADDCAIKCSHISVLNRCETKNGITVSLSWRGGAQAFLHDPLGELADYPDGCIIRQGKRLKIPASTSKNCTWKIIVPSNSISISCKTDGGADASGDEEVILLVDAEFTSSHGQAKIDPRVDQESRSGRLPPKEILDMINLAEAATSGEPANKGLTVKVVDDSSQELSVSAEASSNSVSPPIFDEASNGVTSIGCQKIDLFSGEDIVLGTSGLFENYVGGRISFVSMHLPEWLFLDQASGDIMGTVPLDSGDEDLYEFTVYALDEYGHSAKATIEIDCHDAGSTIGPSLHDQEVREGKLVRIETTDLFADFGLEMQGLEYSATGLPAGLSINGKSGIISGKVEPGTAGEFPYEIVVTAADSLTLSNGVGMRFLLQVKGAENNATQSQASTLFGAIEKLYRLNRECETILAQYNAGSLLGFSSSKTTIHDSQFDSEIPQEQEMLSVEVISPGRTLYLRINDLDGELSEHARYGVEVSGESSLPEWIKTTPEGFIQIECSPDRQFVDLDITTLMSDGPGVTRNIRVDTIAGEILPDWASPLEKQLRVAVAV